MVFDRKSKKALVAVIFFAIVGGLGFGIFRLVVPVKLAPTPDPIASLAPLKVISTKILNIQSNDYDFIAKISNPNLDYGSGDVKYELKFYDLNESLFYTKTGSFYILPGQIRYMIDTPLHFDHQVARVEFQVKSIDWQKIDPLSAGGTELITKNVNFVSPSQPGLFAKAGGSVVNAAEFDFDNVDVIAVALDSSDQILAVNKTVIKTFLSRTERGFEVSWFTPFVGSVDHIDAEALTNVFNNLNFLRRFGGTERFQQLY